MIQCRTIKQGVTRTMLGSGEAFGTPIKYSQITEDSVFVLELGNDILGLDRVLLKGRGDEEAVLCTAQQTFRLREVHTSNLSLLLQSREREGTIIYSGTNYFEPERIVPDMTPLRSLLLKYPWRGQGNDDLAPDELEERRLLSNYQASDEEIRAFLKSIKAVVLDGKVRVLSPEYLMSFFELLLANCALAELDPKCMTTAEALRLVEGTDYSLDIAGHILCHYSGPDGNLDGSEICRLFGEELLKARRQWSHESLMTAWSKLAGDLNPDIGMLDGLYLGEASHDSDERAIAYYPHHRLPQHPEQRLAALFDTKPRWKQSELVPFLKDTAHLYGGIDVVIVKFCRISTDEQGSRLLTSKIVLD